MISLETAKALKDAGLVWKPKLGDLFNTLECIEAGNTSFGIWDEETQEAYDTPGADIDGMHKGSLWLPRLDQMLKDIEGQGVRYILEPTGEKDEVQYCLTLLEWDDDVAEISFGNGWHLSVNFCATSPEEAAAQALLWILNQK